MAPETGQEGKVQSNVLSSLRGSGFRGLTLQCKIQLCTLAACNTYCEGTVGVSEQQNGKKWVESHLSPPREPSSDMHSSFLASPSLSSSTGYFMTSAWNPVPIPWSRVVISTRLLQRQQSRWYQTTGWGRAWLDGLAEKTTRLLGHGGRPGNMHHLQQHSMMQRRRTPWAVPYLGRAAGVRL